MKLSLLLLTFLCAASGPLFAADAKSAKPNIVYMDKQVGAVEDERERRTT